MRRAETDLSRPSELQSVKRGAPEDSTTGLDLLEVVDCRASDVAVSVQEDGEALQLLAHQEAQGRQHGYAACTSRGSTSQHNKQDDYHASVSHMTKC